MINIEQKKRKKQWHKLVSALFLGFFIFHLVLIPIYSEEGKIEAKEESKISHEVHMDEKSEEDVHEFQLIESVESTCITEGFYHYKCNHCPMEYTIKKAKLGHHYVVHEQLATCTNEGKKIYLCDRCGDSYSEITQPIHPHEYTTEVVKVANDTEEGIKKFTCKWCGTHYEEHLPPLGHDYQVEEVVATCTQPGKRYYRCRRCAHTYVETVSPILAHHYKSVVIKEVSTTEEGIRLYICSRCGKSYEEKIQMLQQELSLTAKQEKKEILLTPENSQALIPLAEGKSQRPSGKIQLQEIPKVIKTARPANELNYLIRGASISIGILFLVAIISDFKLLLWYRNKKKKRREGL
ncbi:MAG: hypothetical protein RR602_07590 [Longicatena sp.]